MHGELDSSGYLVLPYSVTKLNLNNTGDTVFLYNPAGQLIHKAEYLLQAKEGASFARREDGTFAFTDKVTMGAPNVFNEVYLSKESLNFQYTGALLMNSVSGSEVTAIVLLASVFLAAVCVYTLKDVIIPKEELFL